MNAYWVLGHRVRPLPTMGDFSLIEIVTSPGTPGPPPHNHPDAAEFFYVAEGTLDVFIDGEWSRLQAGESVTLEPGQVHTLANNGTQDVRWLTGWSPRGFEEFFTLFGLDASEPGSREASVSEERIQAVATEAAKFGMVLAE